MNEAYNLFTDAFATETGIDAGTAARLVTWLSAEGVLDNEMLAETYGVNA